MAEIRLEHITKSFEQHLLFDNLSLPLETDKITALLGSSGSGKTTILRLIAGLEIPEKGNIHIDKQLVTQNTKILIPPHERGVGFIFQDLALWPHFTVYKNIAFGLKIQKKEVVKKQVLAILDYFDLLAHSEKFPHQLSGGQKQLVAIARSLVLKPKVLLMDEPLANLDVKLKHKIVAYIKDLKQSKEYGSGLAIVYVTHDHKEAFALADRIVLLEKGKIIEQGTVDEIKQSDNTFVNYFLEY